MNKRNVVEQAMKNAGNLSLHISRYKGLVDCDEHGGNSYQLRQNRCTLRFLTRIEQLHKRQLGKSDFLAAMRDFVLFVEGFQVPEKYAQWVREEGDAYGLSLAPDMTVQAEVTRPDWYPEDDFICQVYGLKNANLQPRQTSTGDAWLYATTGFSHYRSFEQKVAVHTALSMPAGYS